MVFCPYLNIIAPGGSDILDLLKLRDFGLEDENTIASMKAQISSSNDSIFIFESQIVVFQQIKNVTAACCNCIQVKTEYHQFHIT